MNKTTRNQSTREIRPARKNQGFTLVEMLVVVAIITLLLSLLAPALQGVRERARSAACRSNLRNLTNAWLAFCTDHNGNSITGNGWQWQRGDMFWRSELQPYIDVSYQRKNIMCPSITSWDPNANQTVPGWGTAHTAYRGAFFENGKETVLEGGYAFNDRLIHVGDGGAWWVSASAYYRNVINIQKPAKVPTFSDGILSLYVGDPVLYAPPLFPFNDGGFGGLQRIAVARHNRGINMAFADGHVQHVKLPELYTFKYGRDTPDTPPDVSKWFPPAYR